MNTKQQQHLTRFLAWSGGKQPAEFDATEIENFLSWAYAKNECPRCGWDLNEEGFDEYGKCPNCRVDADDAYNGKEEPATLTEEATEVREFLLSLRH